MHLPSCQNLWLNVIYYVNFVYCFANSCYLFDKVRVKQSHSFVLCNCSDAIEGRTAHTIIYRK